MSIRRDMQDLMKTEVQRFKKDKLTPEEEKIIEDDVTACCIIIIRKILGDDFLEEKGKEIAKHQAIMKATLKVKDQKKNE